jgi:hypothetical protein
MTSTYDFIIVGAGLAGCGPVHRPFIVMAGLDPAIHGRPPAAATGWMPGSSPGMTNFEAAGNAPS